MHDNCKRAQIRRYREGDEGMALKIGQERKHLLLFYHYRDSFLQCLENYDFPL
jgi:hypothetical protein